MLEIKDLSVQYGKQAPIIEHFNLSMKKGEIISVVGESGSGKIESNDRKGCRRDQAVFSRIWNNVTMITIRSRKRRK